MREVPMYRHFPRAKPAAGGRKSMNGRGTTIAKHAQGTPTQSHVSSSILVYKDEGHDKRL